MSFRIQNSIISDAASINEIVGTVVNPGYVSGSLTINTVVGAGASITQAISFARTLNAVPRVLVSLNQASGATFWSSCTAQVADVTTTGFNVIVRNPTGSPTTGSATIVYQALLI